MNPTADQRFAELAAGVHAGVAELCRLAVEVDAGEVGQAFRHFGEWASIFAGVDVFQANEMVRVGRALQHMPQLRTAFAAGKLSFDKVRWVTRVATAADEEIWTDLALNAPAALLKRLVRSYRKALEANKQTADERLERTGLWAYWDDDGMLRLKAARPPEEGAAVLAAIEAVAAAHDLPEPVDPAATQPLMDRWAVRRATALHLVCEHALASEPDQLKMDPETRHVVVHVDEGVLNGSQDEGRCHLEGGPPLSTATVQWLACDATVVRVIERDGVPVDAGRRRRRFTGRQRKLLQIRDRFCRFPGCNVPARRTQGHHLKPWAQGGPTDLCNGVSLCWFHHSRHHAGAFRMRDGLFELPDGRPIRAGARPGSRHSLEKAGVTWRTPLAGDAGPCQFGWVVDGTIQACSDANARAGP
ncbi:MAG TPA: DUF222 domain-containing protein [Candidatus Dormibacteraeota bacterium]